jgi:U3 small nucleolar RNA-associated protein 13
MAYKADIKTTFEPSRVIQPIYTGGSVSLSEDGTIFASCLGEEALLTNISTGAHLARIEGVSVSASISRADLSTDHDYRMANLSQLLYSHQTPHI